MKKAIPIIAWAAATVVAVSLSAAAVSLVGNRVTSAPTPSSLASADDVGALGAGATSTSVGADSTSDVSTTSTAAANTGPTTSTGVTVPAPSPTATSATGPSTTQPSATTRPGTTATTQVATTATTQVATTTITQPQTSSTTEPDTTSTTEPDTTSTTGAATTTTTPVSSGPFTYQVDGGTATVSCVGNDVSLNGASPAAGYTLTVVNSGPQEVRVEFEASDDDSEIRVKCEAGVPQPDLED